MINKEDISVSKLKSQDRPTVVQEVRRVIGMYGFPLHLEKEAWQLIKIDEVMMKALNPASYLISILNQLKAGRLGSQAKNPRHTTSRHLERAPNGSDIKPRTTVESTRPLLKALEEVSHVRSLPTEDQYKQMCEALGMDYRGTSEEGGAKSGAKQKLFGSTKHIEKHCLKAVLKMEPN